MDYTGAFAEAADHAVMLRNEFTVAENVIPLGESVLVDFEKLAAASALFPVLGAVPDPAGKVMSEGGHFNLILHAADLAAAELETLFGAGRGFENPYVNEVVGAGFPHGVEGNSKSAVLGKLAVEHIEIAGLVAVAGAVCLGVPAEEMVAFANKGAVRDTVNASELCDVAVVRLVVVVGIGQRAADAAVGVIDNSVAASSDEQVVGIFRGDGSVGGNYAGIVCHGDSHNELVKSGAGNIVVLEGEARGIGAFVDFAVGEGGAVFIPLIRILESGIFGNSA